MRFKRLYRILDIKLCKYLVFLQNTPLKLKIKALKIFVRVMIKFVKRKLKVDKFMRKQELLKMKFREALENFLTNKYVYVVLLVLAIYQIFMLFE